MSRIEELESERENLHLEQLKLQNMIRKQIHGFALKLTIQESNFRNFVIKFLAKQTCMFM